MLARYPRGFIALMVALAVVFWMGMGATALLAHQVFERVPDRAWLSRVTQMARSSVFYDRHGRAAFTISKEQRFEVPLDSFSPHLQHAILAIEDQRFYDHSGVDVIRVGGAALANFREGRRAEGASTITQQLARLSFLNPEKTYTRKLQEVMLAASLETEYSKEQILELYLNKVYFGSGLYGAEAAALGYFGKHASELTVAEAALLAGLVKAPSSYAPTVDMARARNRRAVVLNQMRGMGVIDDATYEQAKNSDIEMADALRREEPYGRFYKEHVRRELVARFGEAKLYEGGLKVYTTIDLDMQRAADAEVQKALEELDKRRGARARSANPAKLQASLIAIDPATGEVRAMIGGRDFIESNYNRATLALRQSGSAFKPFVYAAALENGYTPASVIANLNKEISTPQGAWVPEDEHSTASSMTMRAALKSSSNRAAVRMFEDVGISKAATYADRLGVNNTPHVPSAALGAGEVTLESLTAAYAVFANGGVRRSPTYITRVEDSDGQVLYTAQREEEQVISPQTAFLMTEMLADVINHGTAYKARQLGFKLRAAGKTGTTNEYRDAWFVGYTPRLVTGVWVGFDQPQTIMRGGYASEVAVPLWAGFMRAATSGDKNDWYKRPEGIVTANVCRLSGKRPAEGCSAVIVQAADGSYTTSSSVYTEYFVTGTVPGDTCPLHIYRATIDSRTASWSGGTIPAGVTPAYSAGNRAERVEQPSTPVVNARGEVVAAEEAKEPEPKKRGFWSRLFGRGKDKDDDKKKDDPQSEPRPDHDR
ncbi:MAG TPA: PBP1A family penicillin-binding protein [Vicinamibacterales bacterium]|nr:PBP1A family penicillin-binding protein [Vicinamibacterales bacterium]